MNEIGYVTEDYINPAEYLLNIASQEDRDALKRWASCRVVYGLCGLGSAH